MHKADAADAFGVSRVETPAEQLLPMLALGRLQATMLIANECSHRRGFGEVGVKRLEELGQFRLDDPPDVADVLAGLLVDAGKTQALLKRRRCGMSGGNHHHLLWPSQFAAWHLRPCIHV